MTVATALLDRPADQPWRAARVLLVDADDTARRAMAGALRVAGLDVTAVPGDGQALAVLTSVRPDVLITGVGLVATLRVREVGVPVLAIGPHGDRVAAFQSGADDFLAVPFGPAELIGRVTELARSRV
jgi:DNA-binding response OmpR family regulator